jgi:hypothetical protein
MYGKALREEHLIEDTTMYCFNCRTFATKDHVLKLLRFVMCKFGVNDMSLRHTISQQIRFH